MDQECDGTLKGFDNWRTLSGFERLYVRGPRVLEDSNPKLKLANAFGVSIKVREIKRVQKDPEGEDDDEEVVFEGEIQLEIALRVFCS